jgi:hypothetical protein
MNVHCALVTQYSTCVPSLTVGPAIVNLAGNLLDNHSSQRTYSPLHTVYAIMEASKWQICMARQLCLAK